MISAQRRMLTLLGITFVLATLMTISHYGGPPETGAGRRLVLNDVDKQKLIKLLNLVPYSPPSVPSSQQSLPSSVLLSNDKSSFIKQESWSNKDSHRPQPRKPILKSSSPSSSLSSQLPNSSVMPSSTIVSSAPPGSVLNSSPPPPALQQQLSQLTSSSGSPPPPSPSSSSSSSSIVTTLKHSPSPANGLDYHSLNDSPSQSPSPSSVNRTELEEEIPKGPFTPDEIALTNQFIIEKQNFCDTDNGASLDLLIFVTSAAGNFNARQAIRETWGKFAVERGALLLFLIGNSRDEMTNEKVIQEDSQYSDLLQGAYIDSYYNLTLKTMSMMKWVTDNCDKVKFVLKVDDDMFINMQMLIDFCETRTFTKSIIGHIGKKWKPHRDPKSKWHVPESAYNGTYFPNFATGPCYIFSGDAAKSLSDQSFKMKQLRLEDVFMTGIVAEAAKIRRLNYSLMKNVRVKVTPCNFKRFMTSHKHTPKEIVTLWDLVYDNIDKPCQTKSTTKPAISTKSVPKKATPKASPLKN